MRDATVFYILTCGSTASVWLSRVLTQHPEIVCFHGVKTIPAGAAIDPSEPLARQFVRELKNLYRLSQGEQIFGATHGFGALEIAPEIAVVEGSFTAMIRHPITRLNSLFQRAAEAIGPIALPRDDIYRPFRDGLADEAATDEAAGRSRLAVYVHEFQALCNNVLAEDRFILEEMEEPDIFRYERIVVEPEYFRTCFERLAEGCRHAMSVSTSRRGPVQLQCTDDYLDRVFRVGNVNRKTGGEPAEDIFARWPQPFKTIFGAGLARQGGKDAIERYKAFGYPLPGDAQALLAADASAVFARGTDPDVLPDIRTTSQSDDGVLRVDALRDDLAVSSQVAGDADSSAEPRSLRKALKQMLAVLNTERAAHAQRVKDLQQTSDAERDALGIRVGELGDLLAAERAVFANRIQKLQETIVAERVALSNRIDELDEKLINERTALGDRVEELHDTLAAERKAFRQQINEAKEKLAGERKAFRQQIESLWDKLGGERGAFEDRIRHLQEKLASESAAFRCQITKLQDKLAAERHVFGDTINELQATLAAERGAFGKRIESLEETLAAERLVYEERISITDAMLAAERTAFGARIYELLDILAAERAAFSARIADLDQALATNQAAPGARRDEPQGVV